MTRYSEMLANGIIERGHKVQIWTAKPRFFKWCKHSAFQKWFGYIDQYIIFPWEVRRRIKKCSDNTLFVFTDNALGPWVPLVAKRHHVIHCHDFMAQLSALGEVPGIVSSWTGKQYQLLIRKGFMKGKNFICVSKKTNNDLQRFVQSSCSEVVYNGLNELFSPLDPFITRKQLSKKTGIDLSAGYILHVGGNQWYKNRIGVIEIYDAWRKKSNIRVPLLLIGTSPNLELLEKYKEAAFRTDIHFLKNVDDQSVRMAYSGASLFLFPSLMEGFGWPIVEAMSCGSLVVTTNEPPMTEVAGLAAFFITRRPLNSNVQSWAAEAADVINKIFSLLPAERQLAIASGIENANRFNLKNSLDRIESIYKKILENKNHEITAYNCKHGSLNRGYMSSHQKFI